MGNKRVQSRTSLHPGSERETRSSAEAYLQESRLKPPVRWRGFDRRPTFGSGLPSHTMPLVVHCWKRRSLTSLTCVRCRSKRHPPPASSSSSCLPPLVIKVWHCYATTNQRPQWEGLETQVGTLASVRIRTAELGPGTST